MMQMETREAGVRVGDAWNVRGMSAFPRYDRHQLGCGIAHLGLGDFHRSHQAPYVHRLLQEQPGNWMIQAVATQHADLDLVRAMDDQECLYTLTERAVDRDTIKVIGSIKGVLHAPSQPSAVVEMLAGDEIKIISMTVTEDGYCSTSNGELDWDDSAIRFDLIDAALPISAIGYLYAAAARRATRGGQPFTVLSCDDIASNGALVERLLLSFAERKSPAVAHWIARNVSFPSSIVGRVTPVVALETSALVHDKFGIEDPCAVASEPHLQWIIEDDFINGRPELERVGVQFVSAVEPYEKLRSWMLDGSRTALGYISYLLGHRSIHRAIADPLVDEFVRQYMDHDVTPVLPQDLDIDIEAYKANVRERFLNPVTDDHVQQSVQNGSDKIRSALLPALKAQLVRGGSFRNFAFVVAAWCRYLQGVDEAGAPILIDDPMRVELISAVKGERDDAIGLLGVTEVFGMKLKDDLRFVAQVHDCFGAIKTLGIRQALVEHLAAEEVDVRDSA